MTKVLVKVSMALAALALLGGALQATAANHRPDGPGFMMGRLAKLHDQLKLTPEQDGLWRQAEAKTRDSMKQMREAHGKMHEALKRELAKSEPDFAAVAAISDEGEEQRLQARHEMRDLWLKVYAGLSPEQKTMVRDFMRERLAKAERFREKFQRGRQASPSAQ